MDTVAPVDVDALDTVHNVSSSSTETLDTDESERREPMLNIK